jgi:hypothetical protein
MDDRVAKARRDRFLGNRRVRANNIDLCRNAVIYPRADFSAVFNFAQHVLLNLF